MPDSQLAEIVSRYRPDDVAWQKEFAIAIGRLVQPISQQIPSRLRVYFSEDDLAQETLLHVTGYLEQRGGKVEVNDALVYSVASRLRVDQLRRYLAKKRMPEQGIVSATPTSSMNLLNDVSGSQNSPSSQDFLRQFWAHALSSLDERERELIELQYVEGLSMEEIATLLGTSAQAIRGRAYRLRNRIKSNLATHPDYSSMMKGG